MGEASPERRGWNCPGEFWGYNLVALAHLTSQVCQWVVQTHRGSLVSVRPFCHVVVFSKEVQLMNLDFSPCPPKFWPTFQLHIGCPLACHHTSHHHHFPGPLPFWGTWQGSLGWGQGCSEGAVEGVLPATCWCNYHCSPEFRRGQSNPSKLLRWVLRWIGWNYEPKVLQCCAKKIATEQWTAESAHKTIINSSQSRRCPIWVSEHAYCFEKMNFHKHECFDGLSQLFFLPTRQVKKACLEIRPTES